MIKRYVKKPIPIEAIQWNGNNLFEIDSFFNGKVDYLMYSNLLCIPTLEGQIIASIGDYIIKGIHGEFYPCKPDIFEESYTEVKEC